ncbi:unnamed protein product, partial [Cuscuta campestris]
VTVEGGLGYGSGVGPSVACP